LQAHKRLVHSNSTPYYYHSDRSVDDQQNTVGRLTECKNPADEMTVCDDSRELIDENSLNVIHVNPLTEEPVLAKEDDLSSHSCKDHSFYLLFLYSILSYSHCQHCVFIIFVDVILFHIGNNLHSQEQCSCLPNRLV